MFPHFDPSNFAHRVSAAGKLVAGGHRRPKDLRDTYACHLLSLGVPLGWISRQLGHSNAAVTARHYARWIDPEGGWRPEVPADGEVLSDLLEQVLARATAPDGTGDVTRRLSCVSGESREPATSHGGPPGTRTQNQRVKRSRKR